MLRWRVHRQGDPWQCPLVLCHPCDLMRFAAVCSAAALRAQPSKSVLPPNVPPYVRRSRRRRGCSAGWRSILVC